MSAPLLHHRNVQSGHLAALHHAEHGLAAQLEPQMALVADLVLLLSLRELVTISELMVSVTASLRPPRLLLAPVHSVIVERLRPPFMSLCLLVEEI